MQDNVQEYQLPTGWRVEDVQDNVNNQFGFTFLKPEIRTLSKSDLPPDEQDLFISDGIFAVKMFKGGAPIQATFITEDPIQLSQGEYLVTVKFFADRVVSNNGGKEFHTNPDAAKVQGVFGSQKTAMTDVALGQPNSISFPFNLQSSQALRVGLVFQANLPGSNNGWFIDDWSLVRTK